VMVSSAASAAARSNRPPPLPLHSTPLHSPFPCLFSRLPLTSFPHTPLLLSLTLTQARSAHRQECTPSPSPLVAPPARPTTPQEAQPRGAAKRSSQERQLGAAARSGSQEAWARQVVGQGQEAHAPHSQEAQPGGRSSSQQGGSKEAAMAHGDNSVTVTRPPLAHPTPPLSHPIPPHPTPPHPTPPHPTPPHPTPPHPTPPHPTSNGSNGHTLPLSFPLPTNSPVSLRFPPLALHCSPSPTLPSPYPTSTTTSQAINSSPGQQPRAARRSGSYEVVHDVCSHEPAAMWQVWQGMSNKEP
ncbi:hypothetical protein QJQ45_022555, partial [Haematococcus lacustris]